MLHYVKYYRGFYVIRSIVNSAAQKEDSERIGTIGCKFGF